MAIITRGAPSPKVFELRFSHTSSAATFFLGFALVMVQSQDSSFRREVLGNFPGQRKVSKPSSTPRQSCTSCSFDRSVLHETYRHEKNYSGRCGRSEVCLQWQSRHYSSRAQSAKDLTARSIPSIPMKRRSWN